MSIWQKQKLKTIKDPKSISRWLVVVTQNITLDCLKKKHFVKEQENIDQITLSCAYDLDSEAHNNELKKNIELFLNNLTLKERRIATLNILYELEYEQISKIVNLPIGTVSSVIKRTKEDLKKFLVLKGYKV